MNMMKLKYKDRGRKFVNKNKKSSSLIWQQILTMVHCEV